MPHGSKKSFIFRSAALTFVGSCILVLSLSSCGNKRVTITGEPNTDFHRIERKLRKHQQAFGLEKVHYHTYVTYKTDAFRKAYVDEYARIYRLTAEQKTSMLEKELAAGERYYEFFVSHYATDKKTARISKEFDVWKLSLSTEPSFQQQLLPSSVTTTTDKSPVLQYFFPEITPWSNNFVVRFEKSGSVSEFPVFLEMTGVAGDLVFAWKEPT